MIFAACFFSCIFNFVPEYEYRLVGYGVNKTDVVLVEDVFMGQGRDARFKCEALKKERELSIKTPDELYTYYIFICEGKPVD